MKDDIAAYAKTIIGIIEGYEKAEREKSARGGVLTVDIGQEEFLKELVALRQEIVKGLLKREGGDNGALNELFLASEKLRGALFGQTLSEDEEREIEKSRAIFKSGSVDEKSWLIALALLSFYIQPFDLPLQEFAVDLSDEGFAFYLRYALRQPHLMRDEDDARYRSYYKKLTSWILRLLESERADLAARIVVEKLTFGACYYVDGSTVEIIKARGKILEALIRRSKELAALSKEKIAPHPAGRKVRLGILSRNRGFYTDTRALYAMFHVFDPEKYEIYWYSLDILDPTTRDNPDFTRKMDAWIHKAVSLKGSAAERFRQIREDDLDFFVLGTAYYFSAKDMDQVLAMKLARVQVSLASLVSGSSGLASFDYYVIPEAPDESVAAIYESETTEKVKRISGPLLWYEKPDKVFSSPEITREKLGIPPHAVLYASGAAVNKYTAPKLRCWFSILRDVPGSFLLLFPFNPAWGGYFVAPTFLARLRSVLSQFPEVDPSRIVVAREVAPDDFERLLQLADIYLGSFPRDGATACMQALRIGKPVVARKEKWLHTPNDALMLRSVGLGALIGEDNKAVRDIAVRLGRDPVEREGIARDLMQRMEGASIFDAQGQSRKLQVLFDEMWRESSY